MPYPVVLDLETQYTFQEVRHDPKKLKVSLVGIYDYAKDDYRTYLENELSGLFAKLEHASFIVGFNINKFDLPVLSPYYFGNVSQFTTLDLLEEVEKVLGFRVALDDLARATLGVKKKGHGFLAIEYFKKREWGKLRNYCLEDVRITKELFEFGKRQGKLYFQDVRGKRKIPVLFEDKISRQTPVSLSLPF